jgi:hypothetical protein
MSMQRLGKRLYRPKAPADAGQGYDPVLADQWNDAAGARTSELHRKQEQEGLTDDERAEYSHLTACSKAWRRRYALPWELANLDPTITDADRARAWKLRLQPFRSDEPPLTEEEQHPRRPARRRVRRARGGRKAGAPGFMAKPSGDRTRAGKIDRRSVGARRGPQRRPGELGRVQAFPSPEGRRGMSNSQGHHRLIHDSGSVGNPISRLWSNRRNCYHTS